MPYKPGECAPKSGTYYVMDESGGVVFAVYLKEGEVMPQAAGSYYDLKG